MKYRTIVADPPWDYGQPMKMNVGVGRSNRLAQLPYAAMTEHELANLPVSDLADDDCRLFLWATNTHMPAAFRLVDHWGFTYRQTLVWEKTRSTPQGHIAPNRAEFVLVARRGHPTTLMRLPSCVLRASPRGHSEKPESMMDWIERASPGPYLELFARRQRLGWDTWGLECLNHIVIQSGNENVQPVREKPSGNGRVLHPEQDLPEWPCEPLPGLPPGVHAGLEGGES